MRFKRAISYFLCAIGIIVILYGVLNFLSFMCVPGLVIGQCIRPQSYYVELYVFLGVGFTFLIVGIGRLIFRSDVIRTQSGPIVSKRAIWGPMTDEEYQATLKRLTKSCDQQDNREQAEEKAQRALEPPIRIRTEPPKRPEMTLSARHGALVRKVQVLGYNN